MTEYVHLIGAEQVQSAGNAMRSAAEEMTRAVGYMDSVLQQHQRFLDDWLSRYQTIVEVKHD